MFKKCKCILSLLFAVAMVINMMPIGLHATDDTGNNAMSGGEVVSEAPVFIFKDGVSIIEAESVMPKDGNTETGNYFNIVSSEDASGGAYISITGSKNYEMTPETFYDDTDATTLKVNASYQIEVPEAGEYVVWVRGRGATSSNDSVWVCVDSDKVVRTDSASVVGKVRGDGTYYMERGLPQGENVEFGWDVLTKKNSPRGIKVTYEEAGLHTINIVQRDKLAQVDKIVIIKADKDYELEDYAMADASGYIKSAEADVQDPVFVFKDGVSIIEAESVMPKDGNTETGNYFNIVSSEDASGGAYISITGSKNYEMTPETFYDDTDATTLKVNASYQIEVPEAGEYVVWVRGRGATSSNDSVWVCVDSDKVVRTDSASVVGKVRGDGTYYMERGLPQGENVEFGWDVLTKKNSPRGIKVTYEEAGLHTINIVQRDKLAQVDKIVIIKADKDYELEDYAMADASGYIKGAETDAQEPIFQFDGNRARFEAEAIIPKDGDAKAGAYFTIIDLEDASGKKYISIVQGIGEKQYVQEPSTFFEADGVTNKINASYKIKFPAAGTYYVWLKASAKYDESDYYNYDSISVGVDSNNYQKVEMGANAVGVFSWEKIPVAFEVTEGIHTLDLVRRDPEVRIDEIIVTNDSLYHPNSEDSTSGSTYEIVYMDEYNQYVPEGFSMPTQHPRVYFTQEDIDKTIKPNLLKEQNASAYASWLTFVEDTVQTGELKNGAYNDEVMKVLEAKAFYYAVYKNDTDSEKAADALAKGRSAVEIMSRVIYSMEPGSWNYNQAGQTIYVIGVVYDWCYDLLDDATRKLFHDGAMAAAPMLDTNYPPTASGVHAHGAESNVMRDLLVAGIAMYDEEEYQHIWYNTAGKFFSDYVEVRKFLYSAHMHTESEHYANYRFQWDMLCTQIFDVLGQPEIFGEEQELVMMNYLYTRRPDGLLLVDGDSSQNSKDKGSYYSQARSVFLAANYYGNEYLKYEAMRCLDNMSYDTAWTVNQGLGPVEILIFNDPDLEGKPYDDLPLTWEQPSPKGGMVARTDWSDGYDSPAVVAEMKIDEYYTGSHQHLDAGSFQIYYKGILATDDGYYQAYRSDNDNENNGGTQWGTIHWHAYARRSIAHNTMLIYDPDEEVSCVGSPSDLALNDGGQRQPNDNTGKGPYTYESLLNDYKVGEVLGQEYGLDEYAPNYTYLKGDIADAYSDKVENYERSFMFLNLKDKDHPAVLMVFDRVVSADASFKKSWLCHGLYEPSIVNDANQTRTIFVNSENCVGTDSYNGKLTIDTLLPAQVSVNKVQGHIGADGIDYYGNVLEDNDVNEGEGWRIEVSPAEENKQDYFLNVLQVGDADGAEPLDVTLIETDTNAGAVIADRVVLFGKYRDRTENDVTFSFEGNVASYEITVADLKEGTWSVEKDGTHLCNAVATEDGGVVVFNGGAGQYTLKRVGDNATREEFASAKPSVDEGISIRVHGRFIYNEVAPITRDNCVLASLETVCTKIGAEYEWDETAGTATASIYGRKVIFINNSAIAYVDGEEVQLETAAIMSDGTLMVPVIFAAENLECKVDYDPFAKVVNITPLVMEGWENAADVVGVTGLSTVNVPENLIDRNLSTIWAYNSADVEDGRAALTFELKKEYALENIEIYFNPSKTEASKNRTASFQVLYSLTGEDDDYVPIIEDGKSDPAMFNQWEVFTFEEPVKAKYVRYVALGSDQSTWNAVKEIRFTVAKPEVASVLISGNVKLNNKDISSESFSASLYQTKSDYVIDDENAALETIVATENGAICFAPLSLPEAGIYYYAVAQEIPAVQPLSDNIGSIDYDDSVYGVKVVVVKDDTENKLVGNVALVRISDNQSEAANEIIFNNVYIQQNTDDTSDTSEPGAPDDTSDTSEPGYLDDSSAPDDSDDTGDASEPSDFSKSDNLSSSADVTESSVDSTVPSTGDGSNISWYITVLGVSGVMFILLLLIRRKA